MSGLFGKRNIRICVSCQESHNWSLDGFEASGKRAHNKLSIFNDSISREKEYDQNGSQQPHCQSTCLLLVTRTFQLPYGILSRWRAFPTPLKPIALETHKSAHQTILLLNHFGSIIHPQEKSALS